MWKGQVRIVCGRGRSELYVEGAGQNRIWNEKVRLGFGSASLGRGRSGGALEEASLVGLWTGQVWLVLGRGRSGWS